MPERAVLIRAARLAVATAVCLASIAGGRAVAPARAGGLSPATTVLAFPAPPILATAAAVMDAGTGRWIYLAHADTPLPMASTTKIMTAVLAIEHGHLDDLVPVSRAAANVGGSSMGLVEGERVRMRDLLYGLMLPSGNDAGVAIAEHLAGSMPAFARLMNARAAQLGLQHTHYLNAYGAFETYDGDSSSHYSSARDLVLLARHAMQSPLFRRIVGTRSYTVPATGHNRKHVVTNINQVLFWYPGVDGVKPGWTSGAGLCQVVDVRRNGRRLIAAILHTVNLHTDVRDLLNYGFRDFAWIRSTDAADPVDQVVDGGTPADPVAFFPYTGHSVYGAFRTYFQRHGGLEVFGFPRTEPINVDGDVEQFFTNQVLSMDTRTGLVTPLRLGFNAVPGRDWLARMARVPDTSWRTYYPETGHTITYRFRAFYLANGGPGTFGYPISEKRYQGASLAQYFENTEFIWHPTSGGTGYIAMAPFGQDRLGALGLLPTGTLGPAIETGATASPTTPSSTPQAIATLRVLAPAATVAATVAADGTPTQRATAAPVQTAIATSTGTSAPPTATLPLPSPTGPPGGTDTPVPPVTPQG